ncbi:MAG: hypothetical protein LBH93_01920 [Chitinispirillales bacterium]|jgi:REP element-mobilizing transposase RayT|nr:hypothetical protein [Chitinispirillales bacterium]
MNMDKYPTTPHPLCPPIGHRRSVRIERYGYSQAGFYDEYIRGVKTLGWKRFNQKLWQRSYHEHVIRSEQSYQQIANYIVNNPINWKIDDFYTE